MAQIQLKMKRHLHNSFRALFLSIAVLLAMPMMAAVEVEIDGINYELVAKAKQATVIEGSYSGEVVIPESVEHEGTTYSVTSIGEYAFDWCYYLTSVTIPNSVTSIGRYAFNNCSGLTSVTIPNSVTSIGVHAFYGCEGLTSVHISDIAAWCNIEFGSYYANPLYNASHLYLNGEKVKDLVIPNSVTSIGWAAFYGFSGLTSVTIGNSVTSIGGDAFWGCSSLTSVTIGNSVKSIGGYAFYECKSLTSVTIPNSVTSIGRGAFIKCSGLTSVTIGNGVESIEYRAFSYCSKLLDVYCYAEKVPSTDDGAFYDSYPANATLHVPYASVNRYKATAPWSRFGKIVDIFTEIDGINYDFDAETKKATVIEKSSGKYSGEVVIPESVEYEGATYSVTSIGKDAFEYCTGLTSVTIPNSVTSIGRYAFNNCSGLTSVTIGNSVESIGASAFDGCSRLTSVTIPNSVKSIESSTFAYCSGLTSVTIGNSVTSIGTAAFYGCSALTSVTIGNSVTSIGGGAFYDCSGLTSVTIPNSVESIGTAAFYGCSALTSVTIGNSVTSIGVQAFVGCSGLTSVTIGNSVTSIGDYAFYECSGLTSVTISNSVESIAENAFYNCSSLTSVTIGSGVKNIYPGAFANCPELLDVYCYTENVPYTYSNAFNGSYIEYVTLHVHDGSIDSYKTTEPWSKFGKIVALGEEETGIGEVKGENGKVKTAVYDLSGRRVQKGQKGIYIQKGKVMVK